MPWTQSISTRLSVLFGLILFVALMLVPRVSRSVLDLARIPEAKDLPLYIGDYPGSQLLHGSTVDSKGKLRFDDKVIEQVDKIQAARGVAILLVDPAGEILAGSQVAREAFGPRWNFSLRPGDHLLVPTPSGTEWPALVLPYENRKTGRLNVIQLLVDPNLQALEQANGRSTVSEFDVPQGTRSILDRTGFDSALNELDNTRRLLVVLASLAATVLLAYLTSRLVTRRVLQLAQQANSPQDQAGLGSVEFAQSGDDEIAHLGAAMNRMQARIQELIGSMQLRDQARREWVAQVSHDLRTPLTALIACLDRAHRLSRAEPAQPEELQDTIEIAKLDSLRVLTLAEDLLEIARLDAGDRMQLAPVPPAELARSTLALLSSVAKQRGVALELSAESGLPILEADGPRLVRALENLLSNALHHANKRVLLEVGLQGDEVCFDISDDGAGFPNEGGQVDLASLSKKLSRQDSTGIGLKVAERVASAHGGRLEASNAASGGARIRLVLPLWPAHDAAAEGPEPS